MQNPQVKRQDSENEEVEDDPEEELVQSAELEMKRSKRAKAGVGRRTLDCGECASPARGLMAEVRCRLHL